MTNHVCRILWEGQEIFILSKFLDVRIFLGLSMKYGFTYLKLLHVVLLIQHDHLFCLSADKSRVRTKRKFLRRVFWTKSLNYFKLYNICTSFESTHSEDFKNIVFIEIEYLNRKLANLCNFSGQNDQFRFQNSNMVIWHIKLKLEAHKTFCHHSCQKIELIVGFYSKIVFFFKNFTDYVIIAHDDQWVSRNCNNVTI